jgi:hypothetical protein
MGECVRACVRVKGGGTLALAEMQPPSEHLPPPTQNTSNHQYHAAVPPTLPTLCLLLPTCKPAVWSVIYVTKQCQLSSLQDQRLHPSQQHESVPGECLGKVNTKQQSPQEGVGRQRKA